MNGESVERLLKSHGGRKAGGPRNGIVKLPKWTLRFGQDYANTLYRRQPKRGDKRHLDEVVLTMNGSSSRSRKSRLFFNKMME